MPTQVVSNGDGDGASTAVGASALIQTIVWSVVVLVLLVVGILLLIHFKIL
ncbi:MAG TPA: hypothetical protein VFB34_10085 [Chloroflexota bacterium]|nr:hypothetical protein [Chloroflexota bacterium]